MNTEITIICDCGKKLEVTEIESGYGWVTLTVLPCDECLTATVEEALAEAQDEAQAEANRNQGD